jgi:tetratricopeptide (TPR) repeat protein
VKENLDALIARVDRLIFGANPIEALEPFDRAVALYDADPDEDQRDSLLMTFAYLLLQFDESPDLPLDRTRQILDDLERRHLDAGNSLRIVHFIRWTVARQLGDRETTEAAYEAWMAAPRDSFAWCDGCELVYQILHLIETGRPAEAVLADALAPESGSCHRQSNAVPAALLPAYVTIGAPELAVDAHLFGYRHVRDDADELFLQAQHIRFCALTGNQTRARELAERHRGGVEADVSMYDELWFSVAAGIAFGGGEFADRAFQLAAEFDRRNGNTHQSQLVRTALAEQPWVDDLLLFGDGQPTGKVEAAHRMHLADRNIQAVELGEQVLADGTEPESLQLLRNVLFAAYLELDEPEAALAQVEFVLENTPADGHGMILRKKGELLEGLNRDEEALETLVAAAAQYRLTGELHDQVAALRLAAQSARYVAELERADALLIEAQAVVDDLPADGERTAISDAVVHWELALLRDMQGELAEAIELATTAAVLYESAGQAESAQNARDYVADRQQKLRS